MATTTTQTPTPDLSKPPTTPVKTLTTVTPPGTPNATSTAAHQLVSEIRDIHDALCELTSLAPAPRINALLTRLVDLCVVPYSVDFTTRFFQISGVEVLCEKLRPICSAAEGELEKHWAQRMIDELDTNPHTPATTILQTFPYYTNYIDLSRLEASIINSFIDTPPTSIAFLGSGPLPLTSLCFLSRYPYATLHNVDRDATALALSSALCTKLGVAARMKFEREDVSLEVEGQDGGNVVGVGAKWTQAQVVFLAALVGMDTQTKLGILRDVVGKLRKGTLVVVRSAWGVRGVLYPILTLSEDLQALGLEVLAEVHPWTKVVNSVVVLRVK
ncbi:hypothetical protein ACJQWK_08512 [Exserohilum turcicum]|uniref:Nicotianamine synthase n=1 Tax=Exserohilum turcicum (strain 28A) TaxID=671987 RepID=R0IP08_EXST2|nr:uncharacterized protein SETTUDRAFT_87863 [Exserohilum turcica Et28A]EOA86670.1 hypothetical protein SETTUDRAFT_87863 [Exserohilum turcica Et28A]